MTERHRSHCTTPLCPGFAEVGGKCGDCATRREQRRGSARSRGYGGARWRRATRTVLMRDPWCKCDLTCCARGCFRPSQVADHYPRSRKELLLAGVDDPDDPKFLRGLSKSCHSKETNRNQPGPRYAPEIPDPPLGKTAFDIWESNEA